MKKDEWTIDSLYENHGHNFIAAQLRVSIETEPAELKKMLRNFFKQDNIFEDKDGTLCMFGLDKRLEGNKEAKTISKCIRCDRPIGESTTIDESQNTYCGEQCKLWSKTITAAAIEDEENGGEEFEDRLRGDN